MGAAASLSASYGKLSALVSRRLWLGPALVFAVALAVYVWTAPSGLTWANGSADGGDLAAAALVGGVPHPSGYPTATLLARALVHLPWHTGAWRVTLLSMLSGAMAAALVAATVQHLTLQPGNSGSLERNPAIARDEDPKEPATAWHTRIGSYFLFIAPGVLGGLALAFSPLLWGQATVVEVYALNAFFAAWVIWALVRWLVSGKMGWAVLAGVAFGLALGNHLTILWMLPLVIACFVFSPDPSERRSPAMGPFALAMASGLLVYLYLPLAAQAAPPINWGNPQTAAGFWWLVSGQIYRPLIFAVSVSEGLGRLAAWASLLWREFLPWGVALSLAGVAWLWQMKRAFAIGMLISLALGVAWAAGYNATDSLHTLLPGWVMIGIWIGLGTAWFLNWLRRVDCRAAFGAALAGLFLLMIPLTVNWSSRDLSKDDEAESFIVNLLQAVEPDALVITVGDRATFALWYARYGLEQRPDIIPISRELWSLPSYRQTVASTHPSLVGDRPLPALEALLSVSAKELRPVYLVQVGASPTDGATLGLPESYLNHLQLELTAPPSESSSGWTLWKLALP